MSAAEATARYTNVQGEGQETARQKNLARRNLAGKIVMLAGAAMLIGSLIVLGMVAGGDHHFTYQRLTQHSSQGLNQSHNKHAYMTKCALKLSLVGYGGGAPLLLTGMFIHGGETAKKIDRTKEVHKARVGTQDSNGDPKEDGSKLYGGL